MKEKGGLFLLFALEVCAYPQNPYFCLQKASTQRPHTKINEISKKTNPKPDKIRVRSRLFYLENASFPFVSDLLRSHKARSKDHIKHEAKNICRKENTFHSVSSLWRLHKVHDKKHMQIEKVANRKYNRKTEILTQYKNKILYLQI
jgi:hypothetical protein